MSPDGSFTGCDDRQKRQSSPAYTNPYRVRLRKRLVPTYSFGPDGSYGSLKSELTPHGYVSRY